MTKEQFKNAELGLSDLKAEYDEFRYHTTHDLAALFRHITVFSNEVTQLLSKSKTDENGHKDEITKYVDLINNSGKKGTEIINAMQDYSELDHAVLRYEAIDLNSLITQVITKLSGLKGLKHIDIFYKNMPTIVSDKPLLSCIFYELLKNSISFCTERDDPAIHIQSRADGNDWRFEVIDNGKGLLAGSEQRIFKILTCAHHDRKLNGLGMGLAMVQKSIERLGGNISAHSNAAQGVTIKFSLPKFIGTN